MSDGREGLVPREHRAGDLGAVHAFEDNEVPAGIDDCNRHEGAGGDRGTASRLGHALAEGEIDLEAAYARHCRAAFRIRSCMPPMATAPRSRAFGNLQTTV